MLISSPKSLIRSLFRNRKQQRRPARRRKPARRTLQAAMESLEDRKLLAAVMETGVDDQQISAVGDDSNTDYSRVDEHASAYNALTGEYLVVWSAVDGDTTGVVNGEHEIFGQIVSDSGIVREHFRISDAGGTGNADVDASNPDVVWNAETNQYLVVWDANESSTGQAVDDRMVFGQLLDADGDEIGPNDFAISDFSPANARLDFAQQPSVAWNAVSNEYLVAWQSNDAGAGLEEFELRVFAQRIDASGNQVGANDFLVSILGGEGPTFGGAGVRAQEADVASNPDSGEFLVTWTGYDTRTGGLNPNRQIFAQRLATDGAATGFNRIVTGVNNNVDNQTIVYNSRDNQYLVAWKGGNTAAGLAADEAEVFVKILDAAGEPVLNEEVRVSDVGGIGSASPLPFNPAIAWNSQSNEYLVTWSAADSDVGLSLDDSEIFGQRIDAWGNEIGENDFRISQRADVAPAGLDTDVTNPSVAWSSQRNEYFVTWNANNGDPLVDGDFQIYGQRLEVLDAIPLDFSHHFNADAIFNRSNGTDDPTQVQNSPNQQLLQTQSFASAASPNGDGLPDNGYFPPIRNHPSVQLEYNNNHNGPNARMLAQPGDSVTVDASGMWARYVYLYEYSTDPAPIRVELIYADGGITTRNTSTADWSYYSGIGTTFYQLNGDYDYTTMDGQLVDSNDRNIAGHRFDADVNRELSQIRVTRKHDPYGNGEIFLLGSAILGHTEESLVVTTLDDEADGDMSPGDLSLREALHRAARYWDSTDTITFDPSLYNQTMTLEHGELRVFGNTEIVGPGADLLTISGDDQTRIFDMPVSSPSVRLSGLTLTDGWEKAGNEPVGGGALRNVGTLVMDDVAIRDSFAGYGGAIFNTSSGLLYMYDSELSGNSSDIGGGAIWSNGYLYGVNNTISGNQTNEEGGGVYARLGSATFINSTIVNNRADADDDASLFSKLNGLGGGVSAHQDGTAILHNTIIAGNFNGDGGLALDDDIVGNFNSNSTTSLIGVDRGAGPLLTVHSSNQVGTIANPLDPVVGPLKNNGGPTRTHALLHGSPAIDAGVNPYINEDYDQRGQGFDRLVDGDDDGTPTVDIGAYEYHGASLVGSLVGRNAVTGDWHVARSDGFAFTTDVAGFWSPAVDWRDVNTADVNGDGRGDVVGRDPATGVWWVGLSDGSTFINQNWGAWASYVDWVDVHIADVNGDGNDDIVGRQASNAAWWVALSNGVDGFTNQLWGQWTVLDWLDVTMADVNGDGNADILGRQASNGNWWVGLSNGTDGFTNQLWGNWAPIAWADVNFADVNGDGSADIVGRQQSNGNWWVGLSNGTNGFTNQLWGGWTPIGWTDVATADVNGDGHADIVGRQQSNGDWWVGLSDGAGSFSNQKWGHWTPVGWDDVQYTDVDGDGNTDIVGRRTSNNDLWVGLSDGSDGFDNQLWGNLGSGSIWSDVDVLQDLLSV